MCFPLRCGGALPKALTMGYLSRGYRYRLHRDLKDPIEFPKSGGTIFGASRIRVIEVWGLHFGPLLCNYHTGIILHYFGSPNLCLKAVLPTDSSSLALVVQVVQYLISVACIYCTRQKKP